MILDVPSKLVFCDSMFPSVEDPPSVWNKKFPFLANKFYENTCAHQEQSYQNSFIWFKFYVVILSLICIEYSQGRLRWVIKSAGKYLFFWPLPPTKSEWMHQSQNLEIKVGLAAELSPKQALNWNQKEWESHVEQQKPHWYHRATVWLQHLQAEPSYPWYVYTGISAQMHIFKGIFKDIFPVIQTIYCALVHSMEESWDILSYERKFGYVFQNSNQVYSKL